MPSEIDVIVRRCLEKDPANRPQTVEELIGDLRHAIMRLDPVSATARGTKETAPLARRRTTRTTKEKVAQSDPAVRSGRTSRSAKAEAEEATRRQQAEQERLLQEARARAEEEARKRAEHEQLLAAERERAEAEAKRRAELERKLSEERARAEEERRRHAELARKLEAERKRVESSGDSLAFPPSTLAKLDETTPPQSFHPLTLPQMSLHPEAFIAASNPTLDASSSPASAASNPYLKVQDTMAESIAPVPIAPPEELISPPPARSRTPLFVGLGAGAVLVLIVIGLGIYMFLPSSKTIGPAATTNASPLTSSMVAIPGGSFTMGREIGTGTYRPVEGPPHQVNVGPVLMDKTEVTSAEYAECVKSGDCPKPPHWSSNEAPKDQAQWPVTNVSLFDAQQFASWRSKRDHVSYRLPTEDEWEYAARSGSSDNLYPWGKQWVNNAANIASKSPQPVGSYPQGASAQGVLDLIGNVWEWTSSKASKYPRNPQPLEKPDENKYVFRGGCYGNDLSGEESVTATSRRFLDPTERSQYIGFRLVRSNN